MTPLRARSAAMATGVLVLLAGCSPADQSGPPVVHLGDSVCTECGMIISDERFATATIIADERGDGVPLLFDDFNCQARHEARLVPGSVLRRWAHDHTTNAWLSPESAHYVHAAGIRSPMASNLAAFTDRADAESLAESLDAEVMTFEATRELFDGTSPGP